MTNLREFFEAVALCKCVTAVYNRDRFLLAPHIVYTRHDEIYVDALTVEREGQPPREAKIGTFKLSGLRDVTVTERSFDPSPLFEPEAERYLGETLLAVERAMQSAFE